jgi:DNA repair exonuclease SbcCD ATPase subunit
MIALKKISLKNFRSFLDKQEIPLDKGFYCLKGASGAGKTSILLAIAYTLGLNKIPGTQLQSIFTDAPLQTELELEIDGHPIVLARGGETYYIQDGKKVEGATPLNVKIREIFKNLESVDLLSFRNQRVDGRFLSLDDSDKKSFLSTVLGLTELEDFIGFQKTSLDEVDSNLSNLQNRKSAIQEAISSVKIEDEAVIADQISVFKKCIEDIQVKKEGFLASLKELQAKHESLKQVKFDKEKEVIQANSEKLLKIKEYESVIRELVAQKEAKQKDLVAYQKELSRKKQELFTLEKTLIQNAAEIESIRFNKCYTCNQPWEDSQKEIPKLQTLNIELQQKIATTELYIVSYSEEPFIQSLKAIDEKINTAKDAVVNIELTKDFKDLSLGAALVECMEETKRINHELAVLGKIEMATVKELSFFHGKIQANNENKKLISSLNDKMSELQQKIDAVEKERRFLELSIKTNKEFLSKIFDEILLEISEDINKNISLVPNVKDVSFSFTSSVVSKNGNVKNRIETNVLKNGRKIQLGCLSGGQKSSIELLVDASVYGVISRRTGLDLNWLILDEPFEGLHTDDKEACLEILRRLHGGKTVLVVDHSTETKENFDRFIEVSTNENGVSVINYE